MAGGNKKKKKPAANPARGFATTSIASKPKVEAATEEQPGQVEANGQQEVKSSTAPSIGNTTTVQDANTLQTRELSELSPEELEAQLEASALQQFVENNAAKVKKETTRQVTRYQTDRRLLRSQAEFLSLKDWLPDELMQQIGDLISSDLKQESIAPRKIEPSRKDDVAAKLWIVRQCLIDLEVPLDRVNEVLAWLISNPPASTLTAQAWGIEECLEWLALNCSGEELDEYDSTRVRTIAKDVDDETFDEEDESRSSATKFTIEASASKRDSPQQTSSTQDSGADEDLAVSDLDSDLEPDQLSEAWLRTKRQLFMINPTENDGSGKKSRSTKSAKSDSAVNKSRSERKLDAKLSKIESDVLFDLREAEYQWAEIKIDLVRQAAERKRLQLQPDTGAKPSRAAAASSSDVNDEAEKIAKEMLAENDLSDGEDFLGGIFDALPGVQQATNGSGAASDATTLIRDFGKLTGMSPKRVLEEACKARDGRSRVSLKQISPTTYSCRHSVTIHWSREQTIMDHKFLPSISVKRKPTTLLVSMIEVATPDLAQSEAYVCTVALFLIFSGSPKEEKAHLRLPAAFRDLWDEFERLRLEHVQKEDSITAKAVLDIVDRNMQSPDDDDDNEVVFNANLRRRFDGSTGTSTPTSRIETNKTTSESQSLELQQMWANKSSSEAYQYMLVGRQNLPMYRFKAEALDIIRRNQVTILCGETGCGKSTQLPAFILEHELSQGRSCKIYCTEPRRISAISLAQRVSEEMGERKGDVGTNRSLVGYAIRLESHTSVSTRLVYATTGIVLRMLENADGLAEITHLVIDEVHERSIDTDFLLIVLRSLMLKRPDLKVVLMSATVDAQKFSNYLDGAPVINVPGRTFPVQAYFLEDAIEITGHTNEDAATATVDEDSIDEDQPKEGKPQALEGYSARTRKTLDTYDEYRIDMSLIVKLLERIGYDGNYEPFSKAVLVFLPGIAEIRQLNDMLGGHPRFLKGWHVYPLHSSFSSDDQQAAFDVPPPGFRKIVLATNIAETGITIPDVTCVIDTGKHKEMRFDERRQMSRLIQSFVAKANAKQRRGRAGRVQEGICFHLFTKHRHDHLMVDQQTPEMLRLSLQDLVMRVKICKLGDIEGALAQALDPPSSKNIRRAIDALVEVGALTTGEDLTPLGSQLAKLPLDTQLGKLILLGSIFKCLDFTLTVAAMLSSKSPFLSPMHQKKQADTVRLAYRRGDSDLLTAYNAYSTWRKVCQTPGITEYSFCNKNFLSPQNLANIEDLKAQLLSSLVDAGFVQLGNEERSALQKMRHNSRHRNFVLIPAAYTRFDDNDLLTTSVVAWSFYPKIITRDGKGWRNIANNQSLALHPTSVNKTSLASDVKYLSFYSIMQSSSRFTNAQETTAVSDVALAIMTGEAVFHMYAGVVVIDGNRLRFKVRDWRTMVVLKTLRAKVKEVLAKLLRSQGRELGDRPRRWMNILEGIFERLKPVSATPAVTLR
jgi:ATP-dependent RNA helicase DHX29